MIDGAVSSVSVNGVVYAVAPIGSVGAVTERVGLGAAGNGNDVEAVVALSFSSFVLGVVLGVSLGVVLVVNG